MGLRISTTVEQILAPILHVGAKRKSHKKAAMQHAMNDNPCILVEGPRWGDAEFYGRWLLAAVEARRLFTEATRDPVFDDEHTTSTYGSVYGGSTD
jgi:hypothetical protein